MRTTSPCGRGGPARPHPHEGRPRPRPAPPRGRTHLLQVRLHQHLPDQRLGVARLVDGGVGAQAVPHDVQVRRPQAPEQQVLQRALQRGRDAGDALRGRAVRGPRPALPARAHTPCGDRARPSSPSPRKRTSASERGGSQFAPSPARPPPGGPPRPALTGRTRSSRGSPLLCTAWNCSWLNSTATRSSTCPVASALAETRTGASLLPSRLRGHGVGPAAVRPWRPRRWPPRRRPAPREVASPHGPHAQHVQPPEAPQPLVPPGPRGPDSRQGPGRRPQPPALPLTAVFTSTSLPSAALTCQSHLP